MDSEKNEVIIPKLVAGLRARAVTEGEGHTVKRGQGLGTLRWAAAGLSAGTALIHAMVAPDHWREWTGYGLFFIAVAMAQALYAVALFLPRCRVDGVARCSRLARSYSSTFYALGIVGNIVVVGMYIVSRTLGVPVLGPEAGEVEPVGATGVSATVMEAVLCCCLVALACLDKSQAGT